jgi:hypothetical protein
MRFRGFCESIAQRLCCDFAATSRRLHSDCNYEWNAIVKSLSADGAAIAKRLRCDFTAKMYQLHSNSRRSRKFDCTAIARRISSDCNVIAKQFAKKLRRDCGLIVRRLCGVSEAIEKGSLSDFAVIFQRLRSDCNIITKLFYEPIAWLSQGDCKSIVRQLQSDRKGTEMHGNFKSSLDAMQLQCHSKATEK